MRGTGKVMVRIFIVLGVVLVIQFSSVLLSQANALGCCKPVGDPEPFYMAQSWTCIISGQQYRCEGLCTAYRHDYECEEVNPCDNDYDILLVELTGPCSSRDPNCDGEFALCTFTTTQEFYQYCAHRCPDTN